MTDYRTAAWPAGRHGPDALYRNSVEVRLNLSARMTDHRQLDELLRAQDGDAGCTAGQEIQRGPAYCWPLSQDVASPTALRNGK
jgi:hypothetical protein